MDLGGGGWHSRCLQECRDQIQDICVAPVGIIEAGCIDKEYASSVQGKLIGELDLGGTGFQVRSNSKVGPTACIDELQNACQFTGSVGIIEHTEVFPLPVAPMTL